MTDSTSNLLLNVWDCLPQKLKTKEVRMVLEEWLLEQGPRTPYELAQEFCFIWTADDDE